MKGFSIAALRTNFYIEELDVMFDAGTSGYMSPDHMFITHTHGDHIANIPFHILSPKLGKKIQIYIPRESVDVLENYISGLYKANDHGNPSATDEHYYSRNYNIIGVSVGETLNLEIKGRVFAVEVIRCYHTTFCVGYGFSDVKQKLKKEYIGLSGNDIKILRQSGKIITDAIRSYLFAFLVIHQKKLLKRTLPNIKPSSWNVHLLMKRNFHWQN